MTGDDLEQYLRDYISQIVQSANIGVAALNNSRSLLSAQKIASEVAREDPFLRSRAGNDDAFAERMRVVEIPLLASLRRFARAVDVEAVLQETFLRMWLVDTDPSRVLERPSVSSRFVHGVARNVFNNRPHSGNADAISANATIWARHSVWQPHCVMPWRAP